MGLGACAGLQDKVNEAQCFSEEFRWDNMVKGYLVKNEDVRFKELSDAQRIAFLKSYNTTGQPTGFQFNRVGYFSKDNFPIVAVLMGMDGCAWYSTTVPTNIFQGIIGNVNAVGKTGRGWGRIGI